MTLCTIEQYVPHRCKINLYNWIAYLSLPISEQRARHLCYKIPWHLCPVSGLPSSNRFVQKCWQPKRCVEPDRHHDMRLKGLNSPNAPSATHGGCLFFWLARLVGNEGPSTFTLVYWGFIPSFPTQGQLVFYHQCWDKYSHSILDCQWCQWCRSGCWRLAEARYCTVDVGDVGKPPPPPLSTARNGCWNLLYCCTKWHFFVCTCLQAMNITHNDIYWSDSESMWRLLWLRVLLNHARPCWCQLPDHEHPCSFARCLYIMSNFYQQVQATNHGIFPKVCGRCAGR